MQVTFLFLVRGQEKLHSFIRLAVGRAIELDSGIGWSGSIHTHTQRTHTHTRNKKM